MCNKSGLDFGEHHLKASLIHGKRIVEVGAMDFNGSLRQFVVEMNPAEYIGVDIAPGPGVDQVCDASELESRFGRDSFDVVISTEMLEHVFDWRTVISNLKAIVKPGGVLLLTTRSIGFPYHGYPYDYWRFQIDDMKHIFSDMEIVALRSDVEEAPGVFLLARKRAEFKEIALSNFAVYSILTKKRQTSISEYDRMRWRIGYMFRSAANLFAQFFVRVQNSFTYRVSSKFKR